MPAYDTGRNGIRAFAGHSRGGGKLCVGVIDLLGASQIPDVMRAGRSTERFGIQGFLIRRFLRVVVRFGLPRWRMMVPVGCSYA